jgi:hypothetical protein
MPVAALPVGAERDVFGIYARIEAHPPEAEEAFGQRPGVRTQQLAESREAASVFAEPVRQLVMRGFPSDIFDAREVERLVVQAVRDSRQRPEGIQRRLGLES